MKILLKIEVNDKDINKDEIIEFLKSTNPPIRDSHIESIKDYSNLFRFKKTGKKIRIIFIIKYKNKNVL
jgi:hypothetical protein